MNHKYSKVSYDDLLNTLNKTRSWLEDIGIKTKGTRFEEILNHVAVINKHYANNSLPELIKKSNNEILWYALLQAHSFCEIFEAFNNLKNHEIPRKKFAEMLQGPLLPRHENPSADNIRGRNTLFEMQSAAKLQIGGVKILSYDDIDFEFNSVVFNAQCKRIYSSKRIKQNIDEAASQFTAKMNSNPYIRGIICLSIDKLTGTEGKILQVQTPEEIASPMESQVSRFIEKYTAMLGSIININVIAIFVILEAAAEIRKSNMLTRCRQIAVYNLCDRRIQMRDFHLINQLKVCLE